MVEEVAETLNGEVFNDFVRRLVKNFENAGLDYAFTGALASSFYGVPRTTTDVDVVVVVAQNHWKDKLVSALRNASIMVDEKKIEKAVRSNYRIAEFRDSRSAYSVDIILSEDKIETRTGSIASIKTFFQIPEDLILAKLRMIKVTMPEERTLKDKEDIKAIIKFTKVDVEAVKSRARQDSTISLLEAVLS